MEWIIIARQALLLAGSLAAGVTDYKTGLIPNHITYPMIGLGTVLLFFLPLNGFFLNALFSLGVFLLGYLLYRAGKLGGGDVLLFTGIALLSPFALGEFPFTLNVVFASALLSLTISSVYYLYKLHKKKSLSIKNKGDTWLALAVFLALAVYFISLWWLEYMKPYSAAIVFIPISLGLAFMVYRKEVYKEFFLERITLKKVEEDEILALEQASKKMKKLLKGRALIGDKELKALKKAGIKTIPVYRNLPKLGPYVFLAIVLCLLVPDFFLTLF